MTAYLDGLPASQARKSERQYARTGDTRGSQHEPQELEEGEKVLVGGRVGWGDT